MDKDIGLDNREIRLIRAVLRNVSEVRKAVLFGSRAKSTHHPESDVDLALVGIGDKSMLEVIAEALDSLPMAYRFDVTALDTKTYLPLAEHIRRVGVTIYEREKQEREKDPAFDSIAIAELQDLGYR
uniref:Nucleotidyltransferase domain-containing protein n=1 Tax=Candidatus Kentrum sp. DK TaxID=2126562 RepID=A0A450SHE7_9GAMM|nr:MAG: Nucleotidyltransferase domain-containing protein [Candidatus Kentron sp. DK]VFJ52632.1 MAG: Nucleotidyltransferase domain-containing protein [Candidatus Kentron sp. DK]